MPPTRRRARTSRGTPPPDWRPAASAPRTVRNPSRSLSGLLQEDAEVLVEEDVGVEEDGALRDLPRAVHPAQHVLAAPGQELVVRLQVRAIHEEGRLGPHLAFRQRLRHEIANQMTR